MDLGCDRFSVFYCQGSCRDGFAEGIYLALPVALFEYLANLN